MAALAEADSVAVASAEDTEASEALIIIDLTDIGDRADHFLAVGITVPITTAAGDVLEVFWAFFSFPL